MSEFKANLYGYFQEVFLRNPGKAAIKVIGGKEVTYADLDRHSAQIANCLSGLGVQPGDRVSVQVEKSPEAVFLYLACLRAGFVFHPLNTGYKENELSYFLTNAEPKAVIFDVRDEEVMTRLAKSSNVDHTLTLNGDGSGTLMDAAQNASDQFVVVAREADDMAALLYSSGTTGVPKGIMLSHKNLHSNAKSLVVSWGFTEDDVLLHALPIFHVHGLFVALGCIFLSGGSMRWMPGFNAEKAIEQLPLCTTMMGVPTYYTRLLSSADFNKDVVKNIRLFVSGSAPLLEETFEEFYERTGHYILERYGMTETNMNTSNPLNGVRKAGTVGFPLPGVEVRVVDDNNVLLGQGEIGNLQVKGENVFKGYWKLPEKTAEDFTDDGFFNTGDNGCIDDEGYVAIVGRSKDMVITGGLNVYPKEIELMINDMEGVKESAVIGLPHPDFGEGVVAVIVPSGEKTLVEEDILTALKAELATFKAPKRIIILDELPRNTMGKVQKNILREQYSSLLS